MWVDQINNVTNFVEDNVTTFVTVFVTLSTDSKYKPWFYFIKFNAFLATLILSLFFFFSFLVTR